MSISKQTIFNACLHAWYFVHFLTLLGSKALWCFYVFLLLCFHVSSSVWGALPLPHVTMLKWSLSSRTISSRKPSLICSPSWVSLLWCPSAVWVPHAPWRPVCPALERSVRMDRKLWRVGHVCFSCSPSPHRPTTLLAAVYVEGAPCIWSVHATKWIYVTVPVLIWWCATWIRNGSRRLS